MPVCKHAVGLHVLLGKSHDLMSRTLPAGGPDCWSVMELGSVLDVGQLMTAINHATT